MDGASGNGGEARPCSPLLGAEIRAREQPRQVPRQDISDPKRNEAIQLSNVQTRTSHSCRLSKATRKAQKTPDVALRINNNPDIKSDKKELHINI